MNGVASSQADVVSSSVGRTRAKSIGRRIEPVTVVLFCLALFWGSFFLYTQHNNFSISYHPDEHLKSRQIAEHIRDFSHPQLMLETIDLAVKGFGIKPVLRDVVLIGRHVSAIFAALAVVALALAGYRYGGMPGLLLSGFSMGLCPSILLYAHYMKEDTALLLGVALTLLAAAIYCRAVSRGSQIASLLFLGVAAAIAVSGKYVGIVALVAVLILVMLVSPSSWRMPMRLSAVLVAFSVTVALINYRIFGSWSEFHAGLSREAMHSISHHTEITMTQPNFFFARGLLRETMPHVLILAGLFLASLAVLWKRATAWELFLAFFAAAFLLLVSYCVIPEYRYNLPVIVTLHLMASLAIVRFAMRFQSRWRWIVIGGALAVLVPSQAHRCANYLNQFADDSRVRLHAWVARNVEPHSIILADGYVGLEFEDDPRQLDRLGVRGSGLRTQSWVADFGELQSLDANYIAVSEKAYGRYFRPEARPLPQHPRFHARRQFYEELFAKHELVWSSTPSVQTYSFVNPQLRLYRIRNSERQKEAVGHGVASQWFRLR